MIECVAVIIKDGDKYLVGKRTDTDNWASVGGHIESGESPKQAIIRETQEEMGTSIINPKQIGEINDGNKRTYLFIADDYSTEPKADGKEMKHAIWVTREELEHMNLYEPFKRFLYMYDDYENKLDITTTDKKVLVHNKKGTIFWRTIPDKINKEENQSGKATTYKLIDDKLYNTMDQEATEVIRANNAFEAIKEYTGRNYYEINKGLRTGKWTGDYKEYANKIKECIKDFELKENVVLYRGVYGGGIRKLNQLDFENLDKNIGKIIVNKGFSSASTRLDVAEGFSVNPNLFDSKEDKNSYILKYKLNKGKNKCIPILGNGKLGEHEILIKNNKRFKIEKVEKKPHNYTITLEEI